jgi:hypothetical protein
MNTTTRQQLVAEQGFLKARLEALPDRALLTRRSLEARLQEVADELSRLPEPLRAPAKAQITFNGRPVVGTHGVAAVFGTTAVRAFADAVAAVAASLTSTLRAMGPIPGREQNQLLITGTALGSFGFELEERGNGELALDDTTTVGDALARTLDLLESSAAENDEALADAAEGLDRRALDKVQQFVATLADDDAVCAVRYAGRAFRFADGGEVRRSRDQLSADNLNEQRQTVSGRFEGVLPTRRTFEFRTAAGDVLVGKIDPAFSDPHTINEHLDELVDATMLVTRAGEGRPRYLLLAIPAWNRASGGQEGSSPA